MNSDQNHNSPPKLYQKLFKWICNDAFYEELQGDLEERYFINTERLGERKANAIYRKEVIKMIRPSVMKSIKPSVPFRLSLFKIHWTLSVRSLKRNKVFSAVTTLGFAAAIAISLFLINLIYSGYSLDQQHNELNRIHRVATKAAENGETKKFASSPFELKDKLEETVPGFELLTHVNRTLSISFQRNDSPIIIKGIYVDENFLEIFHFPVLNGNAADIFKDRNSIIITEEASKKLFNGQNPIGQITVQGQVVRAVIASPKNKSHIQFEAIGNIYSLDNPLQSSQYKERDYLYARIAENIDPETLDIRLSELSTEIKAGEQDEKIELTFFLQSIKGMMFKSSVYNEIGSSVGHEGLIMFIGLTVLLLAMACFNYTNLSMARALQRTKEVGIRKVVGSTPTQIISQFLIETFLFSSLGFIIGLAVYVYYSSRIADAIPFPFLEITNYQIIFLFAGFAVLTGCSAGIIPALFFSRISPLALFNKNTSNGKLSLRGLRKLLVGAQLTVSMFCIVLLSLIIDQNRSLRNAPMGIKSDQLLIINSTPETVNLLIPEFEKIPGVMSSTVVSSLPVVDFPRSVNIIKKGMVDSLDTRFVQVDEYFDEVFQPELRLGSFFNNEAVAQGFNDVIVSDALLQKMNIPENKALGTVLSGHDLNFQIVGILEQTISANSLAQQDEAIMLIHSNQSMNYGRLVLKIEGEDLTNTLSQIEIAWEKIYTNGDYQAVFLDARIDSTFAVLVNTIRIITFIGGCIILISILGQLGMALFNAQSKVKEIGIRKVMGAALGRIIRLILKSTLNTVVFAALIATPLAYLVFNILVAPEVRTPLIMTPWLLLKGVLALALMVIGVVISQTWRVANLNPAKSLKDE